VFVGLSARISQKPQVRTSPNFLRTLPEAAARHAAVAACDTLCTSGFVENVIFSYNRPYGGMSVASLHGVAAAASCTGYKPLLRGIGCVLSLHCSSRLVKLTKNACMSKTLTISSLRHISL